MDIPRWEDDWSWDYEPSDPPYWHIYSDAGSLFTFNDDTTSPEERESVERRVAWVVSEHNRVNRTLRSLRNRDVS